MYFRRCCPPAETTYCREPPNIRAELLSCLSEVVLYLLIWPNLEVYSEVPKGERKFWLLCPGCCGARRPTGWSRPKGNGQRMKQLRRLVLLGLQGFSGPLQRVLQLRLLAHSIYLPPPPPVPDGAAVWTCVPCSAAAGAR
jgi:hypothetical protein